LVLNRFKTDSHQSLDFNLFVNFAYQCSSGYISPYA
jgi:hypothetical protein